MIRKIFQIVLYIAAGAYGLFGIFNIATGLTTSNADLRVVTLAAGGMYLLMAAVGAAITFFAKKRPILLIFPALILLAPAVFFFSMLVVMLKGEARLHQDLGDQRTGKWDFGDQPALLAVAEAVVKNDQDAIRVAAKNVPDLQAAGREGTTLLSFAVYATWHHEELTEAVKTLISVGADPNYNNGQPNSFAMVKAANGSARVLQAMLENGGDANGRDEHGVPIILLNWQVSYYTDSQNRPRLDLLLEHGADINSTMPATGRCCAGYSVLLYRTSMGPDDALAYGDALHLLERGADSARAGADGMTLGKMLAEHREKFTRENRKPQDFEKLWAWAEAKGMLR